MQEIKDDYPDDASVIGEIRVNTTVKGDFERGLDLDWFATTLEAGKRYSISLWQPGFSPSYFKGYETLGLGLFDSAGKQVVGILQGTNDNYPIIDYLAPLSGVYYIAAKSLYPWYGIGNYALSVSIREGADDFPDNVTTTGIFKTDSKIVGNFEVGGDRDWYKFHADAGKHYVFFADGPDYNKPSEYVRPSYLKIRDKHGNFIPQTAWIFDPSESGEYFLDFTGLERGKYSVGVKVWEDDFSANNQTVGKLLPDSALSGIINYELDTDRIKLVLEGQKFYTFSVKSDPTYFDLSLYDANGNRITYTTGDTGNGGLSLSIHPLVSGNYYVDINKTLQTTELKTSVPYTVSLSAGIQDDYGDTPATASEIVLGSSKKGVFEAGLDVDVFKIALNAKSNYAFSITATNQDSNYFSIRLSDVNGSSPTQMAGLKAFESVKFGSETWLTFAPATDDTYYLNVGPGYMGSRTYTLKVLDITNDKQAPILIAQSVASGAKEVPLTTKELTFTLSEPCAITNAQFVLTNSSGFPVALWNKGNTNGHEFSVYGNKLTFELPQFLQPGSYTFSFPHDAIHDFAGNQYLGSESFSFTTASSMSSGTNFNDTFFGGKGIEIDGGLGTDTVIYDGFRQSYHLSRQGETVLVSYRDSSQADHLKNIEKIQFWNFSINLEVATKAKMIPQSELQSIEELYVAFFNRIPDAEGLTYWINQRISGVSLNSIAENFYSAAIQFPDLTGYSSHMSNDDFVRGIYANVLRRKDATAPTDQEVSYWVTQFQNGSTTKGELVRTMLYAAHTFKGDATWGWVADLLDNKLAVANYFAVEQGLTYNTLEQNITKCCAIANAVTPTSIVEALKLIGVQDLAWVA